MTRQVLNLGDNSWYFGQVAQRTFAAPEVYDLPAVTEWLPATVPGNVRTDLLALDRIPDPFFGEGYQEGLWVEAVDWWYRRQLELDPLTSDQRAFLIFDGIDYLSAIFVDGQELARHEGMFSRQIIEITHPLRQKGTLNIAVRLWGSRALPRRQLTWLQRVWQKMAAPLYGSWVGIYPDRTATLKCQMSFGWDFAPPIRTMGLWDDVSLVITGPVFIVEASALGQPVLTLNQKSGGEALAGEGLEIPAKASPPEIKDADPQSPLRKGEESALTTLPADLLINLTLDADRSRQVEATIHITPANFEGATPAPFHFLLDLPAGRSSHRLECHLPEAALWQPWDRGQSHLYLVQITVSDSDSRLLDEITLRTGIRAVELDRWEFSLNGQREFSRGLNWVPADSFPGRLHRDDYARLLTLARQSGANLLRVWGGGLREKQAFYDLCDELGLLVWQEFPLACMFLGSYPRDPAYLSLVEAECGAIVRQLRHHPSVVLWGGGNEFSQRRNRPLVDTLATVVNQNDGTRPFIPVSPSFDHRLAHPPLRLEEIAAIRFAV
jgi:beta-mannosidase